MPGHGRKPRINSVSYTHLDVYKRQHSIEVSDVGKRLTLRISDELNKKGILDEKYNDSLIAIVENACLLHDLGNPPFGHFGETAIKKWWKENYKKYIDAVSYTHL